MLPAWLTYVVMSLVLLFGAFRIYLGLLPRATYEARAERNSFYRMKQRSHLVMGVTMLIMGGWLGAMAAGLLS